MEYYNFEALSNRAAAELGYNIEHSGGEWYILRDKAGNSILSNPTTKEKLESFLRTRFKLIDRSK